MIPISTPDHDLLIQLHTKMDSIAERLDIIKELEYRMRSIETSDDLDSERIKALRTDMNAVRQTMVNTDRIDTLEKDISDLKKKSFLFDLTNGILFIIAAIVAWFKK